MSDGNALGSGGEPGLQIDAALSVVEGVLSADLIGGVYLYGSAVVGGLRPDSDVDLLVVVTRRLGLDDKERLITGLLATGEKTRPPSRRPLELTVVAQSEVRPWRYPPRWELQYGEWLRPQFLRKNFEPWEEFNPDLTVLIEMVLQSGRPLAGPSPSSLLDPVPERDLIAAMVDEAPRLLGDLIDDTRNVLLTLARIWMTLESGQIRSKDTAANWALERAPERFRPVLARACQLYLEGGFGPWDNMKEVRACAAFLSDGIRWSAVRRLVACARSGSTANG
ncbi:MAG TPA: aminoglycoside adenylyltransferase family protein [Acidimicrobiia bacterium]|nr:aminoglycoside adenylyltransferase family protein [Acidimicrobiia bacterium]